MYKNRWTKTLPKIEYCENGRYSRTESSSSSGPNHKIPKQNQILHVTENDDVKGKSVLKLLRIDETESGKKSIIEPPQQQKENDDTEESGSKLCVDVQTACGKYASDNMVDLNLTNWETDFSLSTIELSGVVTLNKESQLTCDNKTDIINDHTDPHSNSNRDVVSKLSVSNETIDVPKNVLPEKKIQRYYEEYDDFIQSLSSPLDQTQSAESAMLLRIFNRPVNTVNTKYSPAIDDSKESETTNTSTDSSDSSSSESSTSSTSDSSSDSDSSSEDDSASESDEHKEKSLS